VKPAVCQTEIRLSDILRLDDLVLLALDALFWELAGNSRDSADPLGPRSKTGRSAVQPDRYSRLSKILIGPLHRASERGSGVSPRGTSTPMRSGFDTIT